MWVLLNAKLHVLPRTDERGLAVVEKKRVSLEAYKTESLRSETCHLPGVQSSRIGSKALLNGSLPHPSTSLTL